MNQIIPFDLLDTLGLFFITFILIALMHDTAYLKYKKFTADQRKRYLKKLPFVVVASWLMGFVIGFFLKKQGFVNLDIILLGVTIYTIVAWKKRK